MAALSYTHASAILNSSLRTNTVYLALFNTDPTQGGTGNEASGGGYARKTIAFGVPSQATGRMQVSNTTEVNYGTMSADLGNIGYWAIFDALTGGNMLWFGQFTTAKDIYAGDAIRIPIGNIICTLE